MRIKNSVVIAVLLWVGLLLVACGGSETPIPTPTAVPTLAAVPTELPDPATAVPTVVPTVLPATATPEVMAAATELPTTEPTSNVATVVPAGEASSTTEVTAATALTVSAELTTTVDVAATNAATGAPAVKSLRVAINAAFKPFVYTDDKGQVTGFDIDLIHAMGDAVDVEIGLTNTSFSDLLPGVASGEYDAAISAISVTPDRSQIVSFTVPYFNTGQAPVSFFNPGQGLTVLAGTSEITGVASLTMTTKVGVKRGTTGAAYVPAETPAQAVEFPEADDAFAALEKGEVDAVIVDIPIIADHIKSHPGSIMLTGGPITEEAYAIAVSKDRPEVVALLDDALVKLRANGTYQILFQKWFGTP